MRLALTLSLVSALATSAVAQDLERLVRERLDSTGTPGASVAIVRGGKLERAFGVGLADVEHSVPVGPDTAFAIGSLTKQFTAVLVMRRVEAGTIRLDQSIVELMPDLPEGWKGATVRHLLNHTSGIPSYTNIPGFLALSSRSGGHADLIKLVAAAKSPFAPGEKWSYNNTGYYLLGMLLERLDKKPFRQILKEELLTPLGMNRTDLFTNGELVKHRARGYVSGPKGLENAPHVMMQWPFAAGGLISTVEDMAKWALAQGSEKLLKRASWEEMWKRTELKDGKFFPYGLGWGLSSVPGSKVIEHGGAIPGFQSQMSRYPDKDVTVIVLTNAISGLAESLAGEIAAAIDPSLGKPLAKAIQDPTPALSARLRALFEDALQGKAKPDDYAPEFRAMLFPDAILAMKTDLAPLGPITKFELISARRAGEAEVREYVVALGDTELDVSYTIDAKGKIAGWRIAPRALR